MFEAGEGSSALVFKKPRQHPDPTGLYEHMFARKFLCSLAKTYTPEIGRLGYSPLYLDGGGKGCHQRELIVVHTKIFCLSPL